jgi:hypothetical protein
LIFRFNMNSIFGAAPSRNEERALVNFSSHAGKSSGFSAKHWHGISHGRGVGLRTCVDASLRAAGPSQIVVDDTSFSLQVPNRSPLALL